MPLRTRLIFICSFFANIQHRNMDPLPAASCNWIIFAVTCVSSQELPHLCNFSVRSSLQCELRATSWESIGNVKCCKSKSLIVRCRRFPLHCAVHLSGFIVSPTFCSSFLGTPNILLNDFGNFAKTGTGSIVDHLKDADIHNSTVLHHLCLGRSFPFQLQDPPLQNIHVPLTKHSSTVCVQALAP